MPKATWNGTVLADSDATVVVDGNHYFPPDSVHQEFFKSSDTTSVCGWKGTASYYTIEVDGQRNEDEEQCLNSSHCLLLLETAS